MPVGRLKAVVVMGIVVGLVAVPLWGLLHRPGFFAWQMYAGAGYDPPPTFTRVARNGVRNVEPWEQRVGHYGRQVHYERHVPAFICELHPDTRYVLASRDTPRLALRYPCPR